VVTDSLSWPDFIHLTHSLVVLGDWDLKTMLPVQLAREAAGAVHPGDISDMSLSQPLQRWINIKKGFARHYKLKDRRGKGMAGMLSYLSMELEGRHHSGIDDCRNILRIVMRMKEDGWVPDDDLPRD
jgi:ERI1 exoribonuclease 3